MTKLPSWQFYPGDWRKDPAVQSLSYNDRGVWFEILCLMHESEQRGKLLLNGKKMPDDALARLLGLDKQILNRTLTTLLRFGVASMCPETGALINRRMVRDEEIRKIRTECGKRGGNPHLLNQNPHLLNQKSTTQDNQKSTPSSSSSSSSSKQRSMSKTPSVVTEIFLFWKEQMNHPNSKLDGKRKGKIEGRLKEGRTIEECKRAIENCKQSSFHMGQNDRAMVYDDIELIFRDATKFEMFLNLSDRKDPYDGFENFTSRTDGQEN